MATQLLFGDRDYNRGVLKNHKFTIFADLTAANAAVSAVYGFAYLVNPGSLYYNQNGLAWQPVGGKGIKGDTGATGPAGPAGGPGPAGPAGANGSAWYTGAGAPGALHQDGDFYLNSLNGDVYEQITGVWTLVANIKGPIGNTGPAGAPGGVGPAGPPGPVGPPGIDGSYLKVDFGDPSTHTQSSALDPVAAPGVGIYFHVNTATQIYWYWGGSSWSALPHGYYINGTDAGLWEMGPAAWSYVTSLASPVVLNPIVNASGSITRLGPNTVIPVDSTGGPITLTLFAPLDGDKVSIKDIGGVSPTNPITVAIQVGDKLDTVLNGTSLIDTAFGELDLVFATFDTFPVTTPVPGWWKQNNFLGTNHIQSVTTGTTLGRRDIQTAHLDSTGGAFTLTLPASPKEEDIVHVHDRTGQAELNRVTLAAAAGFEGVTPVVDAKYMSLTLIFRGGIWRTVSDSRYPLTAPVTITANTTLTAKRDQVALLDSTGGAFTLTLPAAPVEEDIVRVKDASGTAETNVITLAAAGTFENGAPVIDAKYMALDLVYRGGTWRVLSDSRVIDVIATISGATTLQPLRKQTILYDVSGGAFAIALQASPREGDVVRLKEKTGSTNVLTVTGTVDGTVNPTFNTAYQTVLLEYLGGAWRRM